MSEWIKNYYEGPDYLKEYFLSLVNIVDNPLGVYNRQCVLNRLKVALPGEAVMVAWCNYGRYQELFYPASKPMPEQGKLDELTQVSGKTWGDYCVPFVCDTIYNVTRETRDCVNMDKVRQSEKTVVQLMGNRHTAFYRYLLETHENPTSAAYDRLSADEKKSGKKDYISAITSPAWIQNKLIAKEMGNWPDPDWELYHHFNKLEILGASEQETADVIQILSGYGLVPESVAAATWDQYARWVTEGKAGGNLMWQDFKEAADAMNVGRSVGEIYCNEIYSSLFMGGPGEPYWQKPPEVSCFSFDTMIRMDDETLKPICEIRPGDHIASPQGAKKVMLVSVPLRGNRPLYSFHGHGFRFTATHPFVTRNGGYACADPAALGFAIPTFREDRVERLEAGTELMVHCTNESAVREPKSKFCCSESRSGELPTEPCRKAVGVEELTAQSCEDEYLYDVIPEPGKGGFQYFAGDADIQYLVSSEVPSLEGREHTAQVFMQIFDQIARPLLDQTAHVEEKEFWGTVQPWLMRYSKTVLPVRYAHHALKSGINQTEERTWDSSLSFSAYSDLFEDSRMNLRIGLLFSAAFSALLPLLMAKEFTLSEADWFGRIMVEDIKQL